MEKSTWVKCYCQPIFEVISKVVKHYQFTNGMLLIGEYQDIMAILDQNHITDYYLEVDYHNAIMAYPHYLDSSIRIEKGAIVREGVTLKKGAIVLMNATVNKGAVIGEQTMIDMNAVVGSGAIIGNNVHVSAGVVIAGVLEPVALSPVVIEDDVFIGANSVVLSGVCIGHGSIIGAGSIVTKNVPPKTLWYGNPARFVMEVSDELKQKTALNWHLREADNT